jgi:oligopeptide transport system ATP-binding protein
MSYLLEVKNLKVAFVNKKIPNVVLKDISFHLQTAESLGIVGESGSGKTVLAHSLVKLLPPNAEYSGQILFLNEDLFLKTKKEMRTYRGSKISYVFQDPMTSLNPTMKIGKQIMEALLIKNKEKVFELLSLVNISNPKMRFSQYPHELSGGQRQRVGIAIALAGNPQILIADEPTTALDVTVQSEILSLLKDLQKKLSMSILFISHDLKIVCSIANRIIVMYAGRIVEEGESKAIINSPKHPYTQLLLRSVPTLKTEKMFSIDGFLKEVTLPGCPFYPRCPFAKAICKENEPPFFLKEQKVACWLYEGK